MWSTKANMYKALLRREYRRDTKRRGVRTPLGYVTARQLGDRDAWRCHLCRKRVDPALRWPDPMSASVDHLIPVSDGGRDETSNLALSHLTCNLKRGASGPAQLLLFG